MLVVVSQNFTFFLEDEKKSVPGSPESRDKTAGGRVPDFEPLQHLRREAAAQDDGADDND